PRDPIGARAAGAPGHSAARGGSADQGEAGMIETRIVSAQAPPARTAAHGHGAGLIVAFLRGEHGAATLGHLDQYARSLRSDEGPRQPIRRLRRLHRRCAAAAARSSADQARLWSGVLAVRARLAHLAA